MSQTQIPNWGKKKMTLSELSSPFMEEEEKAFPRCFEFKSPDPRLLVSVSLGSRLLIALFDIGYVVVKCLH